MSDQTIFPALRYRDAPAAIEWLGRAFGFEPRMVVDGPDGTVAHAQLAVGGATTLLRPPRRWRWAAGRSCPPPRGRPTPTSTAPRPRRPAAPRCTSSSKTRTPTTSA